MATAAQVAEFRIGLQQVESLVLRDLRQLWAGLDLSRPAVARDGLLEVVPLLVAEYGAVAASLAAEFFEDVATVAALVPVVNRAAEVRGATRWAAGGLWTGQAESSLSLLGGAVVKNTFQYARDTVHESTRRTGGLRYARVPRGGDTCKFCITMASRGGVYASKRSAGGEGNEYHDHCYCVPTPIRSEDDYPSGYDPDSLYEMYQAAA